MVILFFQQKENLTVHPKQEEKANKLFPLITKWRQIKLLEKAGSQLVERAIGLERDFHLVIYVMDK